MAIRANIEVTVDRETLLALGAPGGPIFTKFLSLGAKIDSNAKQKLSGQYLKVRTGNLRSSQSFRVVSSGGLLTLINENTATYAAALYFGSRPHEIRPRRAKALTGWSYQGAPVFALVVHHPGTKAKPWLADAQREVLSAWTG